MLELKLNYVSKWDLWKHRLHIVLKHLANNNQNAD